MQRLRSRNGTTVSFETYGSGPPLVLVHGGFSDHQTNWEFVMPYLSQRFSVFAIARRGRGETDATYGHSLRDEMVDAVTVIESISEPVFLLGHSYGAHVALGAAAMVPDRVRKLILYEAPSPGILNGSLPQALIDYAQAGDWDNFSFWFFRNVLLVPAEELHAVRSSDLWAPIMADAKASLGDLRALSEFEFSPERFANLSIPVLLQIGSESPRDLYVTDSLHEILPDVRIGCLAGQAHEGMTTAPEQYADAVISFFTGNAGAFAAQA